MPRTIYPGKKLHEAHNYYETAVLFKSINNHPSIKNIKKPDYQGSLNMDTVQSLVDEYNTNPIFLRYKNKIVIGILNNTYYILDGQHRLEMVRQLGETNPEIVGELHFCWYTFNNENNMRQLFNSINKDSYKNQWFINSDEFKQIKIMEFNKLLKEYCSDFFAKKKSETGKLYTIEEFTKILNSLDFFNNMEMTSLEYFNLIEEKNNRFYELFNYKDHFTNNISCFYKDEHKNIEKKIVMSLKNNNFFQWLHKNINPMHKFRYNKTKIPQTLRKQVWNKHYGTQTTHICSITGCNNILDNTIKNGWEAGHIVSEFNGGNTNLDNLKPICKSCNCSMGTQNWEDYGVLE